MKKDHVIIILISLVVALMATTVVLVMRDRNKKEIEDTQATKSIVEPIPESKEETKAPAIATRKEEPVQEPKEEELKEEPSRETIQEEPVEDYDEYEVYKVDEDWIQYYSGINKCFVVERDGNFYELGWELPGDVVIKYNVGWQYDVPSPEGMTYLWLNDYAGELDMLTGAADAMSTAGDFPVFQIKKGEKIRIYCSSFIDTIEMSNAFFYGYTVMAEKINFFSPMDDHSRITFGRKNGVSGMELLNMDGTAVEDVRNLKYGEEYLYVWYEGTQYNEIRMIANSKTFSIDKSSSMALPVEPTKDGYFYVDTSGLTSGFYMLGERDGLVEIVDEFHD